MMVIPRRPRTLRCRGIAEVFLMDGRRIIRTLAQDVGIHRFRLAGTLL